MHLSVSTGHALKSKGINYWASAYSWYVNKNSPHALILTALLSKVSPDFTHKTHTMASHCTSTQNPTEDHWDREVTQNMGTGSVKASCLQSMEEAANNSLWGSTGMVQRESVFISLKPPVAVIKHLLLIKIPAVLFLDTRLHVAKSLSGDFEFIDKRIFCTLLHRYHCLWGFYSTSNSPYSF